MVFLLVVVVVWCWMERVCFVQNLYFQDLLELHVNVFETNILGVYRSRLEKGARTNVVCLLYFVNFLSFYVHPDP